MSRPDPTSRDDDGLDLTMPATRLPRGMYDIVKLLLRPPAYLKAMIAQAAKTEGMSMNAWCMRVLAEAAKASKKYNWRSIALDDEPRRPGAVTIEAQSVTLPHERREPETSQPLLPPQPLSGEMWLEVNESQLDKSIRPDDPWTPPVEDIPKLI